MNPTIGICVSYSRPALKKLVRNRLAKCSKSHLAIVSFQQGQINFLERTVKGERLDKNIGKIDHTIGVFPIPEVIFLQCPVSRHVVHKLEQDLGCQVFNNFIFNKWECSQLLLSNSILKEHVPDTSLLKNETQLSQFLSQYRDVFLKPIDKACGNGIIRLKWRSAAEFECTFPDLLQSRKYGSPAALWNEISRYLAKDTYIIQQSIQGINHGQLLIEMRLQMNKIDKENWKVSYLVFRHSKDGNHLTNRNERILSARTVQTIFAHLNKKGSIRDKAVKLGQQICKTFDEAGHRMADLGIDLAMDKNGHLWILEVNPLPFPYSPPNRSTAFTGPIDYALSLSSS